jgi:hypothetical protein
MEVYDSLTFWYKRRFYTNALYECCSFWGK